MSQFPETARDQAVKDMNALRAEFDGLSDQYLARELNRIDVISRQAASNVARIRTEMMRRALITQEEASDAD